MTEFEMAYLSQEMVISRTAQISLLISIMSAFLVVGYTAAHRLTFSLNALIVAIYSLVLFPRLMQIITSSETLMGLSKAMAERAAGGTEFRWIPVLRSGSGSVIANYYMEYNALIWISVFVATIAFYFLARRMNLKREREEAAKLAASSNAVPAPLRSVLASESASPAQAATDGQVITKP